MPKPIVLSAGGREYELALTMSRVLLIHDLTGIDLLSGAASGLSEPRNMLRVLYALTGGEDVTEVSFEEFADALTLVEFAASASLINGVLERDAGISAKGKGKAKAVDVKNA